MSEMVTVRDVDIVTAEIVTIKRQTQQVLITAAIELGRRLTEVKAMIPHGEWGKYLQERVDYSQSTADNLMKLYREYGSGQDSLFDNFANSQTFANLSYTQALALLSVPAGEREQFAEENDVAHKSTREIQELIRQREEQDTQINQLQTELTDAKSEKEEVEELLADAEKECDSRKQEVERLEGLLLKAQEAEQKAKEQLKKAKENPVVPKDVMEKLRAEAEAAATKTAAEKAEKETKKIQGQLEKAQKAAQDAEDEKKRATQELAQMEQKLQAAQQEVKMANPDVAVFRTLFEDVQQTFNRMNGARLKVAQADPAMGESLKQATVAVLEQWRKELG